MRAAERDMRVEGAKRALILEELKAEILAGKYPSSSAFPSEIALSRRYKVSRGTIAFVVEELKREGLVSRRRGSGTFVTPAALSRKIGIMVSGIAYAELFPPVVGEITRLAEDEGYAVVLGDTGVRRPEKMAARARRFAVKLVEQGVSGVIFQPLEFVEDSERLNRELVSIFDAANVAVVLFDYDFGSPASHGGYDVVGINNYDAGFRLGAHLAERKARKVSFLLRPYSAVSQMNRMRGATVSVESRGGRVRTLFAQPEDLPTIRRHVRRERPDAILCGDDRYAARLMQTLAKLGLRVPDDILLAGFDDVQIASLTMPGLTTIHQPCEDIAREAFRTLLDRIADRTRPVREVSLPAPLVERDSTNRRWRTGASA